MRFGFTCLTDRDGVQKPQCIKCSKVLCNASMKPSKLKEHFEAMHGGDGACSTSNDFAAKRMKFDAEARLQKYGFVPIERPTLEASYRVRKLNLL